MFEINTFLKKVSKLKASDIHLMAGKPPALRISGSIAKVDAPAITEEEFEEILNTLFYKAIREKIKESSDFDFTYELKGVSRYRVNYCKDLGLPKLTMRLIPYEIPTFQELMLPDEMEQITKFNNGIVLITGATSSGKSTTIASLIENINKTQKKHIITIEDPIEFVYADKSSLVTQRGLGIDVESFPMGIKYALRQDPDIIVIGEIRDVETVEAAMQAAETGHLVLSTIHTNSAVQTINRVVGLFDSNRRDFIRRRLSVALKATVAQKLIRKMGGGLAPAIEMLITTPAVADYIAKDNMGEVEQMITKSNNPTICSMNTSIYNLYKNNIIDKETAILASDKPTELAQMIKGVYRGYMDPDIQMQT